jgi:alpha-L-fucosidase
MKRTRSQHRLRLLLWIAPAVIALPMFPLQAQDSRSRLQLDYFTDSLPNRDRAKSFRRNTHPEAQWYPRAGLGLFVHWGISTVEARFGLSWPMIPGRMYAQRRLSAEEIEKIANEAHWDAKVTPRQYFALAERFHPGKYNPDDWLRAARAAGFRYAVLTTRHHDGFALWPSSFGNFNTKTYMGGQDLVKEFVEACRRNGLKVGLYYSVPDWYFNREYFSFFYYRAKKMNPEFPDLGLDLETVKLPPMPEEHAAKYRQYVRGQIRELLTNYGRIDLLWFDGKTDAITIEEIRELQPSIVVNDRGWGYGDFNTRAERDLSQTRPAVDWWENCQVWAKTSWAHIDEDYRPNSQILEQFVRVRAWNGNFLLNTGPTATGDLPAVAYERMREFGAWIQKNEEAVFGTSDPPPSEQANIPVTARQGIRYLHLVPSFKGSIVELHGINQPKSVRLLGREQPLRCEWNEGTLKVEVPSDLRTKLVDVVKIELPLMTATQRLQSADGIRYRAQR